jgi:two-component system KDP operon response regulator KdpE
MQGYSVVAAETVDGALQEAATRTIDLLLSDHLLEDGNGVDLLRKLRETRKLPAIMMTGRTETALQEQCRRAGFDEFIVKPVDIDALVARVADLLGSARDGSAPVQADTAGQA